MTNTTAIATTAKAERNTRGQWVKGVSGNSAGNASRARRELNADTIRALHRAFREGGAAAINKVMKNQPAVFLKLLVLLVPRELEVSHTSTLKAMSDEQLESAIAAVQAMLDKRAAGAIDVTPTPDAPETSEIPALVAPRRPRRKAQRAADTTTPDDA